MTDSGSIRVQQRSRAATMWVGHRHKKHHHDVRSPGHARVVSASHAHGHGAQVPAFAIQDNSGDRVADSELFGDYDTLATDVDWPTFALINFHPQLPDTYAVDAQNEPLFYQYNPTDAVFIGGLPSEATAEDLRQVFSKFGELSIDWPRRYATGGFDSPPKGYAFLIFDKESCVRSLISQCLRRHDKYFMRLVQMPRSTIKSVQIRAWRLANAEYLSSLDGPCDLRKAVFVGGVPRTMKAVELAAHMQALYGTVVYVGIDVDAEHGYPKGAARCVFASHQSFTHAVVRRYVTITHGELVKKVEIKPYILDDQPCDECSALGDSQQLQYVHSITSIGQTDGSAAGATSAPATKYCAHIACLQYYCNMCWAIMHPPNSARACHEPLQRAPTAYDDCSASELCDPVDRNHQVPGVSLGRRDPATAYVYNMLQPQPAAARPVDAAGDRAPMSGKMHVK